jgi:hypothetical protein
MRVIKEIVNSDYRTTIFNWNNKYIIKLETPSFEQTYKVDQYDLSSDADAVKLLDTEFVQQVMTRFNQMSIDLSNAMMRHRN